MKVIQQTPTQLTLRERPWGFWLFGMVLMGGGVYSALTSGQVLFGGLVALIGVLIILVVAQHVTCSFDRSTAQFTLTRQGFLGTKRVQHPLHEIVAVRVQCDSSGKGRTYRVVVVLDSSEQVPLTSFFSSGERDKQAIAACIRTFLGLSEIPEIPLPRFQQILRMLVNPAAQHQVRSDYDQVVAIYEAAIRQNPDNIEAYRNLALVLAMQNRLEEAKGHLEHAKAVLLQQGKHDIARQFDAWLTQIDQASKRYGR